MTKKTLIITTHIDISEYSDPLIEAYKAFIKASASPDQRVEFEIVTKDEEATADRLLRLVRSEFKDHDAGPSIGLGRVQLNEEQSARMREFLASNDKASESDEARDE